MFTRIETIMTFTKPISQFFWLWIPLLCLASQVICETTMGPLMLEKTYAEIGPYETIQFFILVLCLLLCGSALVNVDKNSILGS